METGEYIAKLICLQEYREREVGERGREGERRREGGETTHYIKSPYTEWNLRNAECIKLYIYL